MRLTKEQILARKRNNELQPIETAWGPYFLAKVKADEKGRFDAVTMEEENMPDRLALYSARLVILVLRDETGAPVFTEDDAHELAQLPDAELERIVNAAVAFNGWAPERKRRVEKNSVSRQACASPTGSSPAATAVDASSPPPSSSPS